MKSAAVSGNTAFSFLALKGAAFTGAAGQLRWFQQKLPGAANDKTIIEGDTNGNRVADFQIQLTGLKTFYSINSSTRTSIAQVSLTPSASAVLLLMVNEYVIGRSTGRSAGLAPRKILST